MWRRSLLLQALLACVLVVGACWPRGADAQRAHSFSLNWVRGTGAEQCIASHELASLIERTLGPLFVAPGEAELAIEGQISAQDGWHARITVVNRRGTWLGSRELRSRASSCRALDAKIALVIELAIDPEVALEQLPPELLSLFDGSAEQSAAELLAELRASPSSPVAAPSPAAPSPAAPRAHAASAPSEAGSEAPRAATASGDSSGAADLSTFEIALRFGLGSGVLPALAAGPGLMLSLPLGREVSLALGAQLWLPQSRAITGVAARPGVIHMQTLIASLSGCYAAARPLGGRVDLCAGLSLAARLTRAEGLAHSERVTSVDLGPLFAAELVAPAIGPVAPLAGLGLHLPFARERITYLDAAEGRERGVFTPAVLAFLAYLGVALRI